MHFGQSLWTVIMAYSKFHGKKFHAGRGTHEHESYHPNWNILSGFGHTKLILSAIMTVQIRLFSLWLSNRKSEFLGYNVIMTRCSRHTGFNVRPRATKTVLGLRLLRSLQSSDSFGGTRADIKPSMPRAAGSLYPIIKVSRHNLKSASKVEHVRNES